MDTKLLHVAANGTRYVLITEELFDNLHSQLSDLNTSMDSVLETDGSDPGEWTLYNAESMIKDIQNAVEDLKTINEQYELADLVNELDDVYKTLREQNEDTADEPETQQAVSPEL